MYQARLDRLRALIAADFECVALVPGPNFTYVTGVAYHLSSDRPLVALVQATGDVAFIIPALEQDRLTNAAPFPLRLFPYTDSEGYAPAFEQACQTLNLHGARIGAEGLRMRLHESQLLAQYSQDGTVAVADDVLLDLRLRKTADELAAMREAIRVSESALESILGSIQIGMTEQHITNMLLMALSDAGGAGNAFDPIVLSGPRTALPHGEATDRKVQAGDLLLFDYGAKVNGYPADITRTFAVGALDPELAAIYAVVLAANEAGLKAGAPGVAAQTVDQAARAVIDAAGYGEYFTHRTGHGLGIDVHEAPFIRPGNPQVLAAGMVYTVEPGIYLPNKGGVRIEDNVTVTASGVEVMTHFPKTLRSIGAA